MKDTGVGIAPDMIGRVFDLFAQADTSLDRAEGGLGIGLTLVERLTRLHGGTVAAHSAGLGHGSTFTVRLPRMAVDFDRPAVSVDPAAAETLRTLMEMSGHAVRLAHDGMAATPAALEFRPDVILLDIGLPAKDGYQVVRELRARPELATTRIVATTGYGREEDRARCLASGFHTHITKPIQPMHLHRILSDVVRP